MPNSLIKLYFWYFLSILATGNSSFKRVIATSKTHRIKDTSLLYYDKINDELWFLLRFQGLKSNNMNNTITNNQIMQVLTNIQSDITNMKTDISDIKVRLTNVENDVSDIKVRLTNVEKDVALIKSCPTIQKELKNL